MGGNVIPQRHRVQHEPFIAGRRDAHGNPTATWGPKAERSVYGWATASTRDGADSRTVADLELFAPLFPVNPRDRFTIPGEGVLYVSEPRENWNTGPWGFEPGMVVPLRRVDG